MEHLRFSTADWQGAMIGSLVTFPHEDGPNKNGMSTYCYAAVGPGGAETHGTLEVADQNEALRHIKEMGLFPIRIEINRRHRLAALGRSAQAWKGERAWAPFGMSRRVPVSSIAIFTRQLATLLEAGMPLLRSLRLLQEQQENRSLKRITGQLAADIESGNSFTEAVNMHPKTFNALYVSMVHAGEISGALELTLKRLAEFMEKAQKIKGKVKAAMVYPCAVMFVAIGVVTLLMAFVLPRFQTVFEGLLNGRSMPAFTLLVLRISEMMRHQFPVIVAIGLLAAAGFCLTTKTRRGRLIVDSLKLVVPVVGPVFRKAAISRFARTLGTLSGSGVPILQALLIVRNTAGNALVGNVIAQVHERVKEGEPIAPTLKSSGIFPVMVAGMIDVGEQTGALPDMLLKVADTYDQEVDSATSAMTAMLEPVMLVFLAVVVGSIVIAMFLPLIRIMEGFDGGSPDRANTGQL